MNLRKYKEKKEACRPTGQPFPTHTYAIQMVGSHTVELRGLVRVADRTDFVVCPTAVSGGRR